MICQFNPIELLPPKGGKRLSLLTLGLLIILFCSLIIGGVGALSALVICTLPFCVLIRAYIATGRTIIFSPDGIIVRFGKFSKTYTYDMVHIEIATLTNCVGLGYRLPYKEGVIITPSTTPWPKWMMPDQYCALFHPWSVIFVYFIEVCEPPKYQTTTEHLYEIDRDIFLSALVRWKVI